MLRLGGLVLRFYGGVKWNTHVEFHNAYPIIPIVALSQRRLDGRNARCEDALDGAVFPQEPQGEVDIVHRALRENARVSRRECRQIELVAGLRAEDRGDSNITSGYSRMSVTV